MAQIRNVVDVETGLPAYQYGRLGKVFKYHPSNHKSRKRARKRAEKEKIIIDSMRVSKHPRFRIALKTWAQNKAKKDYDEKIKKVKKVAGLDKLEYSENKTKKNIKILLLKNLIIEIKSNLYVFLVY